MKVLIFESDPGFSQELKDGFARLGTETVVVDDANQGLQTASRDRPDLILLSIELPRMNGFSVCNKLKRDPGLKDVPLIIMSSDSTEETFEQHRRLRTRAEDYVHKPVSFEELVNRARPFVNMDLPPSEDAIVLDEDIEIDDADVVETTEEEHTEQHALDPGFGDLSDEAFDAIVGQSPKTVPPEIIEPEIEDLAPVEDVAEAVAGEPESADLADPFPSVPPPEPEAARPLSVAPEILDAEIIEPETIESESLEPEPDALAAKSVEPEIAEPEIAPAEPIAAQPLPYELPLAADVIAEEPDVEPLSLDSASISEIPESPSEAPPPPPAPEPIASPIPPALSQPPPVPRLSSLRPGLRASQPAPPRPSEGPDTTKLREELERLRARVRELEDNLRSEKSRVGELEDVARRGASKDQEVLRLQRELDDVKARLGAGKTAAGSAREFLDLREQLNRKDKDILEVRDQLTHREKELLLYREQVLSLEREKAEVTERLSEVERQHADTAKLLETLKEDKEQASKRSEDFKRMADKYKADLDAKTAELTDSQQRYEQDLKIRDEIEASLRKEHLEALEKAAEEQITALNAATEQAAHQLAEALANAKAEAEVDKERALAEAIANAKAEAEVDKERALAEAYENAQTARNDSLQAREAELEQAFDERLAQLRRTHDEAIAKLRADHEQQLNESRAQQSQLLASREAELSSFQQRALDEQKAGHERRLAEVASENDAKLSELASSYEARLKELSEQSERRIVELNAAHERDFSELRSEKEHGEASRDAKIDALAAEVLRLERELQSETAKLRSEILRIEQELASERTRVEKARAKWQDDRASLERVKDALAAALAQVEETEGRPLD